jgi:broad specificity phosphatase PhoE
VGQKVTNILLVRHGESESNELPSVLGEKPDVSLKLTEKGITQAAKTGKFIANYVKENTHFKKVIFHSSSYQRASDTCDLILNEVQSTNEIKIVRTHSDFLVEIIQGHLITLHSQGKDEYIKVFENDYNHWKIQELDERGTYFAKRPLGESYFDLSIRLQSEIAKAQKMYNKKNTLFVIVAHGAVNRCFAKEALNKDIYWFNQLKNPDNCEVWSLNFDKNKLEKVFNPLN